MSSYEMYSGLTACLFHVVEFLRILRPIFVEVVKNERIKSENPKNVNQRTSLMKIE